MENNKSCKEQPLTLIEIELNNNNINKYISYETNIDYRCSQNVVSNIYLQRNGDYDTELYLQQNGNGGKCNGTGNRN